MPPDPLIIQTRITQGRWLSFFGNRPTYTYPYQHSCKDQRKTGRPRGRARGARCPSSARWAAADELGDDPLLALCDRLSRMDHAHVWREVRQGIHEVDAFAQATAVRETQF